MKRVAVTGVGVICSLGRGKEAVWRALVEGRRRFTPPSLFDREGASRAPVAQVAELPGPGPGRRSWSRLDRFLHLAAEEALSQSGLGGKRTLSFAGVAMGNSNGGMLEAEEWFARRVTSERPARTVAPVLRLPASASTDRLAATLGSRGPRFTVTAACSSAAAAIALAAERIRDGEVRTMVAGGGDPLCRLTYSGFAALRLLDPEGCRPFSAGRKGLTLGEGAAVLILEEMEGAQKRGAALLAEIPGYGATCDAHHMTGCHPEGRGMLAAMSEALERSGRSPADIHYVNAHGTATPANDAAEGKAIAALFGPAAGGETGSSVPVSSTKSLHGHLLGGSGAVEAALTVMALSRGVLPPTAGMHEPEEGLRVRLISGRPLPARASHALSNSFGFGGGNVVLVISRPAGSGAGRGDGP